MKIGVLLHGSGVYDGTEIQEAVLSLLAIAEAGHSYFCFAPNVAQHHVVNHLTGDEMAEERNVMVESARIARGEVADVATVTANDFDALVMPGGFGTAKNISQWAFEGPAGAINETVKNLLIQTVEAGKPIAALCMSPTTLAKAFENTSIAATLSVGTTAAASPYDIAAISEGMETVGVEVEMKTVTELSIDAKNKIVCAPCYMMEADIVAVNKNVKQAISTLVTMC